MFMFNSQKSRENMESNYYIWSPTCLILLKINRDLFSWKQLEPLDMDPNGKKWAGSSELNNVG